MSSDSNTIEGDQADGRVSIQLLQVPNTLRGHSGVNVAVETIDNADDDDRGGGGDDESSGFTKCLSEHTKRILIRVLIVLGLLILAGIVTAIETTLGADIINTEELLKVVKGEVDTLISYTNTSVKHV